MIFLLVYGWSLACGCVGGVGMAWLYCMSVAYVLT